MGKGNPMNMSLKEIFLWLVALDFPSIAAIWNWLINVPWWLAVLTAYIAWILAQMIYALAWSAYAWANHRAYTLGLMLRKWYLLIRRILGQITSTSVKPRAH